jgi:hypothetical protein
MSPVLRVGFIHTRVVFPLGLAVSLLAGAEVVVDKARGCLDVGTARELMARE